MTSYTVASVWNTRKTSDINGLELWYHNCLDIEKDKKDQHFLNLFNWLYIMKAVQYFYHLKCPSFLISSKQLSFDFDQKGKSWQVVKTRWKDNLFDPSTLYLANIFILSVIFILLNICFYTLMFCDCVTYYHVITSHYISIKHQIVTFYNSV